MIVRCGGGCLLYMFVLVMCSVVVRVVFVVFVRCVVIMVNGSIGLFLIVVVRLRVVSISM